MKKILILGAGNAQIDAIKYCREAGYEVGGCSYTNTDHGIPMLDWFEQVDIRSVEGVTDLARRHEVDAIYSVGSDLAMPTVMKASENLGLPHYISSKTADICHSKHLLREALGEDFDGNVHFLVADTTEDAMRWNCFPAMMKPVDSQGQRGCFRVDQPSDIEAHFEVSRDYSIIGKVIIEDFIEGPEVSVNGFMQDGKMAFGLVSDRFAFDEYPGGIIKKHRVPSHFADEAGKAAVLDLTERIAATIGLNNGPLYAQIKLDRGVHPVVLEIAPRLDGCHMWRLIRNYCGVDLLDASIRQLTEAVELPEPEPADTDCELVFISEPTGSTVDYSKYDFSSADYVEWYYKDGDTVQKLNGFIEKCGYVIQRAEKPE